MDNESPQKQDTSKHDYVAELITASNDDDIVFPPGFNALSPEEKQEWAKKEITVVAEKRKFKVEQIDGALLEKLKEKGIEIEIHKMWPSPASYDDPRKILNIRMDAGPEFINEYIENNLFKEEDGIDQLSPEVGEKPVWDDGYGRRKNRIFSGDNEEDIHIEEDAENEEDEEEIHAGDPSKWSELNNTLYDLGINLEFNEEHLKKFEEKDQSDGEDKYEEIIGAVEDFPNKERLKEKFSTIRLGYPQVAGDSKIFIEDNILYLDLGIDEQEITNFLNSLVFGVRDEKEEIAPESAPETVSIPEPKIESEKDHIEEKSELALEIENASDFDELYEVLNKAGGIQVSNTYYSALTLIKSIADFRRHPNDIILKFVTSSEGLRDKVQKLALSDPSAIPIPEPIKAPESQSVLPVPEPIPTPVVPEPAPITPDLNVPPVGPSQEEIQANYVPEWQKGEDWEKFEKLREERARAEVTNIKIQGFSGFTSALASFGFGGVKKWDEKRIDSNNLKSETEAFYGFEKDYIAKKIEETFRKNAGENLTPEQEAELNSKINDKIFEELVKKENDAYLSVLKEVRGETKMDKVMENAKSFLNTKAVKWYLGLSRRDRIACSFVIGTTAGLTFGAGIGALGAVGYVGKRVLTGAAGIGMGELVNKKKSWSLEEINKLEEAEKETLRSSDLPLEEKSKRELDIRKKYKKERLKATAWKVGLTAVAGAGTGLLANLAEGAFAGVGSGGATKSALESKGGKTGGIAENKLPPRKGFQFVPIKPSVTAVEEPGIEIKSIPIAEIPLPPKNLDSVTMLEVPEPKVGTVLAEKIFDKPEVFIHKVEMGDSTWKMLKDTLENFDRFKKLGGTGTPQEIAEQIEAKQTRVLQSYVGEVLKNHDQYKVGPNGEIEIGKEVNFSKLFEDSKKFDEILNDAENLKPTQVSSIIENNDKIEAWVQANPGKKFDIDEILSDKPKAVPEIVPEAVPKIPEILKPTPIMTPPPEIPTEPPVVPESPVVEPAPLAKPLINMNGGETVMAGSLGVVGMATTAGILGEGKDDKSPLEREYIEKRDDEQIHRDIAKAKGRLAELEQQENRTPGLERTLVSDSKLFVSKIKFNQTVEEAFKSEIDSIYGERGFMGLGRVSGIKSKEWGEMARLPANKVVEYYTGDSAKSELAPEILKKLEKSKKHQALAEQMKGLIAQSNEDLKPYNNENMDQFIRRLGGHVLETHAKKQSLSMHLPKVA